MITEVENSRVTRLDVARKANVSLATVTYSLNPTGKLRIAAKTQERVRKIARQMNYRPSYMHRALSAGKTYAVGMVVEETKSLLFPLYELIMDGCIGAMNAEKYDPLLLLRSRWERVKDVAMDGRVDGLIIMQSDLDDHYIRDAATLGVPLVVLNRDLPGNLAEKRCACVYPDQRRMVASVVNDFVRQGCRNILNLCKATGTFANQACFEAFHEAIAAHADGGILGSTMQPVLKDSRYEVGGLFAKGSAWDAIFTTSAAMSRAVAEAASEAGLVPGRDFMLICTDAFPETESYVATPRAPRCESTVYWQPAREVGRQGWCILRDLIQGKAVAPTTLVPYEREAIP